MPDHLISGKYQIVSLVPRVDTQQLPHRYAFHVTDNKALELHYAAETPDNHQLFEFWMDGSIRSPMFSAATQGFLSSIATAVSFQDYPKSGAGFNQYWWTSRTGDHSIIFPAPTLDANNEGLTPNIINATISPDGSDYGVVVLGQPVFPHQRHFWKFVRWG
jgi:hypothetical protein